MPHNSAVERTRVGSSLLSAFCVRRSLQRWATKLILMRPCLFWVFAVVSTLSFGVVSLPFEFLGKFSNMTYSQEHQGGEDVYLWRAQNELYGYMEYSLGGALGDYTTARLENIRFDAATKRLSFQARNPLYDEKGNVIRNLFVFDGLIRPHAIVGTLKCRNAITNEHCSNDQKVSWKRVTLENTGMYRVGNRQDWETLVNEQIKQHGARW